MTGESGGRARGNEGRAVAAAAAAGAPWEAAAPAVTGPSQRAGLGADLAHAPVVKQEAAEQPGRVGRAPVEGRGPASEAADGNGDARAAGDGEPMSVEMTRN